MNLSVNPNCILFIFLASNSLVGKIIFFPHNTGCSRSLVRFLNIHFKENLRMCGEHYYVVSSNTVKKQDFSC